MRIQASAEDQVVIPDELRKKYGIKKGTLIVVSDTGEAIELRPITKDYIRKLRGALKGGSALKVLMEERQRDREREDRER